MRRRFGLFGFIAIVQSVIFLSHLVLYETWVYQTPTFAAQGVQAEWVKWVFGAAFVVGLAGVVNASWTRITRTTVRLANLPDSWRGRKAALISDVHLGHVRNGNFLRRMVAKILSEGPDAIFIAGDLYDGTAIDAASAAEPLNRLTAPHGVY